MAWLLVYHKHIKITHIHLLLAVYVQIEKLRIDTDQTSFSICKIVLSVCLACLPIRSSVRLSVRGSHFLILMR
jgi:hypothetical protein